MQIITSKDNENVKSIKKLKEKKHRIQQNCYLIEGIKIVAEAIQERVDIKKIVICEECIKNGAIDKKMMYEVAKYDCIYVSEAVFKILSDVENPQGILAVVYNNSSSFDINYSDDLILILDGIQDPGNLGTIIRTADSVRIKTNYNF